VSEIPLEAVPSPASPPRAGESVPFLQSPALLLPGIRHGFFGRRGGVSTGIYSSLNAGAGSRDAPEAIAENRARIAATMGVAPEKLLSAYQIHSARAVRVDAVWDARPEADAMASITPGIALTALAADCAPVLFADGAARVIGSAHAGWRGALGGVLEVAVAEMERAGAVRGRIVAAVGPCIAPASYEVGPEFRDQFLGADANTSRFFASGAGDRLHFDLPGFCRAQLEALGLAVVDVIEADTCALADEFFSNRRAVKAGEGDFGRNCAAIVLSD
jgi:polyphenol oxidase